MTGVGGKDVGGTTGVAGAGTGLGASAVGWLGATGAVGIGLGASLAGWPCDRAVAKAACMMINA